MADAQINIDIKDSIFTQINELHAKFISLEKSVKGIESNTTKSFDSIGKSIKNISLVNFTQGLQNVTQGFNDLNAPGLAFNTSMGDLQAITGLSGKALDEIGDKARNNAKQFGGNAAKSLESYKLLLSQLTPELAKQPKVLDAMAKNVSLLSKTMGGNTTAATEVLTTAMNQYGVSMENPTLAAKEMNRMMNIMSAAAKEGSSELPTIKQAIENVGGQAKISGLSFETMNSAIQALDKAGKKGAEGGTALKMILTQLGKGRFMPEKTKEELEKAGVSVEKLADKNVSFTEKMRMLQPVLKKDSALINTLFGEYGQAASALIETADSQDTMTKAIIGTNTTQKQANAVMQTTAEKLAVMQAKIDDAKLSFFNATGGASAFLTPVSEIATTLSSFATIGSMFKSGFSSIKGLFQSTAVSAENLTQGTTRAGGAMKGLGSIAKGIGWGAIAAGILAVGVRLWDVATGAVQASKNLEAFQKGAATGGKEGQKFVSSKQKSLDKQLADIDNQVTAGTLKEADARKKKLDLLKTSKWQVEDEIYNANLLKKRDKEELKKRQKQYDFDKTTTDGVAKEFLGFRGSGDLVASTKGQIAESNAKLSEVIPFYDQLESQINQLKAEEQGAKNKPISVIPSTSNVGTASMKSEETKQGGDFKNINVKIENLVKDINITTTNVMESVGTIKKQVTEALVSAVRDFEVAIG